MFVQIPVALLFFLNVGVIISSMLVFYFGFPPTFSKYWQLKIGTCSHPVVIKVLYNLRICQTLQIKEEILFSPSC